MLSDLRRQATMIEEYNCASCGRPLLVKDSACTVCKRNAEKNPPLQNSNSGEPSRLLTLPNALVPVQTERKESALSLFTSSFEGATQNISWERHLPKLLWAFGCLGLILSVVRLVFLDFFQALALFQSSLMLIVGVVVLKRLGTSADTDAADEPEQLRIKFFENLPG